MDHTYIYIEREMYKHISTYVCAALLEKINKLDLFCLQIWTQIGSSMQFDR